MVHDKNCDEYAIVDLKTSATQYSDYCGKSNSHVGQHNGNAISGVNYRILP